MALTVALCNRQPMRILTTLLFLASPAFAQDGLRSSDTVLTAGELETLLSGKIIEFYDGSKSRYEAGGRYVYTYTDDGPEWIGAYSLADDSTVCVDFDNGSSRCDRLVMAGANPVLIIDDGTRFPVRNLSVYAE